jgi:hypothetical protein
VQYDQSGTAVNPELQDLYQFANPGTERTDTDQTYRVQDNIADEFGADTQAAATEVTQAASSETSENFGRGYTVHSAGQYATEFAFGGRRRRVIKPTGAIVLQKLNYRIHPGGLSTQNTVRTSLN